MQSLENLSDHFSFTQEESQQIDTMKQLLLLKLDYQKLKKKYSKLKSKYQHLSDQQEQELEVQSEDRKVQSLEKKQSSKGFKKEPHSNPTFNIQASQNSENFVFDQSQIHDSANFHFSQHQKSKLRDQNEFQPEKSLLIQKSKNSDNFSFSNSFSLHFSNHQQLGALIVHKNSEYENIHPSNDTKISMKKIQNKDFSHQSDNFSYKSEGKGDYSDDFSYQSQASHNQSDNFTYKSSRISSEKQNSHNGTFLVNHSQNFRHEDLANSDNFKLDESQIFPKQQLKQNLLKKQHQEKSRQSQNVAKIQIAPNKQKNQSSIKSYDESQVPDVDAFKYQLKQFSFRLPEQINDPIQINYSRIELQNVQKNRPLDFKKQGKIIQNLHTVQQKIDYEESDEDQTQFYRKLINKLSIKKKIQISQIKKLSIQMQKYAQKYQFLQQIFQTGTYGLDMTQMFQQKNVFLQQLKSMNRTLITELTLSNSGSYNQIVSFFKLFEFPSLKAVTFKFRDQIITSEFHLLKKPDSNIDLNFLRYFGLSKKLRSLTLKGQSMSMPIATSIVDLDFPLLKSLYIGFQATLSDEVVDILLCNKLRNLPKCKIFIASWEGVVDERFAQFYSRIDFQFLETDSQDM